jgi:hypothetical protein
VVIGWLIAFATTLALEIPSYGWGLRSVVGWRRAVFVAFGLNAATHPAAWRLTVGASWPTFTIVEVCVWLTEAFLLWACMRRLRPDTITFGFSCTLSFCANALSAGVGLLLA